MNRRVLITGSSVAGNTSAYWLARGGFDVTVVERAPQFRDGGQNVDVRGAGRTVLQRMGLEQAVADHGTGEAGLAFVDRHGRSLAEFRVAELGGKGFTAELEILRGDLARLLYDATCELATFRFGDAIVAIDNDPDVARVRFASGRQEEYDLVVIAEGVGSSTRELIFKGENRPRWIDVTMAYFTIPKGPGDAELARWFTATGGRSVLLRPDRGGSTRALLTLQAPPQGEDRLEPEQQKAFFRRRFADAGWETPRVLDGLDRSTDFYLDVVRQVKLARWSSGRVVLTGDAAWCATPLSGVGTTLAIVGAYVLAGELCRREDHAEALRAYERIMRSHVHRAQDFPKYMARMAQPQSRLGVWLQGVLLGVAAAPGIRKLAAKVFEPRADDVALPDYDMLVPGPRA